ncbi:eukaryotic translation initiation factor 4 gamma 2-like isoform X2 [Corticium candelabrum]|uniref:eukaryotic translation initiation factor 4 gamma 2-like isoform X2 n=1 Tax=Corticium candelabrum TaxID=121492 RepID=UPI002E256E1B|nr:eukaryotic translation initiation factor 4 gamma 2-like isoform X2 [Corticium candelabrum]
MAAFAKKDGLTPEEEEDQRLSKRKMLGNIQFIGELGKCGMLHESVLHKCVQQWKPRPAAKDQKPELLQDVRSVKDMKDQTQPYSFSVPGLSQPKANVQSGRKSTSRHQRKQRPGGTGSCGDSPSQQREISPKTYSFQLQQSKTSIDTSQHQHSDTRLGIRWNEHLHPSVQWSAAQMPFSTYPYGHGAPGVMSQSMSNQQPGVVNAMLQRQAAVVIQEKSKSNKNVNKKVSKQEFTKMLDIVCDKCSNGSDNNELIQLVKSSHSHSYMDILVSRLLTASLDCEATMTAELLVLNLLKEGLLSEEKFIEGCEGTVEAILATSSKDKINDGQLLVTVAAKSIAKGNVGLKSVATLFKDGRLHPQFLSVLMKLKEVHGEKWLQQQFDDVKLKMYQVFPDSLHSDHDMLQELEDRGLAFLCPMVTVKCKLLDVMTTEGSETVLTWILCHVNEFIQRTPAFVEVLGACVWKVVTGEAGKLVDDDDEQKKAVVRTEKSQIEKWKPLLVKFTQQDTKLQVALLLSLQVFCHNLGFPRGLLLRTFMNLYDLDIVEEEAYLKWKDDVCDDYPGKGKSLFQVNSWLHWLETAAEESSSDGDDG